jgi:putative selenate reductase molybdopterin-binding subunit
VAGAYRGYGGTQGQYAMEVAVDQLADALGMDPLEVRTRNHIRQGGTSPIFRELGEGREGVEQTITSCELPRCIELGAERIGWAEKRGRRRREGSWVHGVGMSIHMQGSGIPLIDMGAASIKVNDDGSINLSVGATDLGTGSDTILGQIAAEVLGLPLRKVIVRSSDTDLTPFDTGAYASSTTYVSGEAVRRAAVAVRDQLLAAGAEMLRVDAAQLEVGDERVTAPDGSSVSLERIALRSLYGTNQHQIAAVASAVPEASPAPFLASFAEVAVDLDTGRIRPVTWFLAGDCGTAINPKLAEGSSRALSSTGSATPSGRTSPSTTAAAPEAPTSAGTRSRGAATSRASRRCSSTATTRPDRWAPSPSARSASTPPCRPSRTRCTTRRASG